MPRSASLLLSTALVTPTLAQETRLLLREGDPVIFMGALQRIDSIQINDAGDWTALVDTDAPDLDADFALLRNGFVTLREGVPLFAPADTALDEFDSIAFSDSGHLAMCLRVSGPREALYWNTLPLALKDSPLVSPLVGPGTDWERFDVVKMIDASQVFVMGAVANPAVTGNTENTLCRFEVDGGGAVVATEVLLTEGQFLPALGTVVVDLPLLEHSFAVNRRGDFITLVRALGTNAILKSARGVQVAVAQEGLPSPVAGRRWNSLVNTPKVWINDRGEYMLTGSLGGDNGYLIERNGSKFAQAGDTLTTYSESPLDDAGSAAPVIVANDGNVFWRANTTASNDAAFLRNHIPILHEDRTRIGDQLITAVKSTDNAFAVSRNGRFFAGRVELQGVGDAVVCVDFGLVLPLDGCAGNVPTLGVLDGLPLPGRTLEFAMDRGNAPGALPFIVVSTRERLPGSECGVNTPYGELLISNAHRLGRITLPSWNGTTASTLPVPLPADLALVDQTFFAQGVFHAAGGTPPFALTNGLRIEIGAP